MKRNLSNIIASLAVLAFIALLFSLPVRAADHPIFYRDNSRLHIRMHDLSNWLVKTTGWEKVKNPVVIFQPRAVLNYIYFANSADGYSTQDSVQALAFDGLIMLPDDFSLEGEDDDMLLHELVHIYQHKNGKTYDCIGDREKEAYLLQSQFHKETGRGKGVDGFWLLMVTMGNCWD